MEVAKALNDSQTLLNSSGGWRSLGPSPDELAVSALIGAILSLMCLGGTAGNAYILVLMCRSLRCRASMYVHIVNLALADLLYLSTVPFIVYNSAVKDWCFGEAGCRVLLTLDLLTMHASIFTLTAMSSERYVAVTRPLAGAAGGPRGPHRRAVTLLIWLLSFCLTLPLMIAIHVEERLLDDGSVRRLCTPAWSEESNKLYLTVLFGTSLLAPGLVIGYLYAGLARAYWLSQTRTIIRRSPRLKVLGLIFVIVLTYWACFLPFWSWQLVPLYAEPFRVSFKTQGLINNLVTCLTYGNSCVNPFFYTLLTKNYKEYLRGRQRGVPAAAAASRRSREAVPAGGRPRRAPGLEEAAGTPGV